MTPVRPAFQRSPAYLPRNLRADLAQTPDLRRFRGCPRIFRVFTHRTPAKPASGMATHGRGVGGAWCDPPEGTYWRAPTPSQKGHRDSASGPARKFVNLYDGSAS